MLNFPATAPLEQPCCPVSFGNNLSGVSLMLRAITQLRKSDLHTLFDLHVRAHGEAVADAASAETVFAVDCGITPFDWDRIAAEYF